MWTRRLILDGYNRTAGRGTGRGNGPFLISGAKEAESVPFPQIDSRSEDGDFPLPVLDRLVTPLLSTRSRLLIRRPSPLAFRACLRYVVLIFVTPICFVSDSALFLPFLILL
jgi:hypothetical protein